MYESGERIWPPELEQPALEVEVYGEKFLLCWQDTTIQLYRTGLEEYDGVLSKYDHVVHKYNDTGENADYVIFTFEQLGEANMKYLVENSYPCHTDPIPDDYILNNRAARESLQIPDTIDPDMGEAA